MRRIQRAVDKVADHDLHVADADGAVVRERAQERLEQHAVVEEEGTRIAPAAHIRAVDGRGHAHLRRPEVRAQLRRRCVDHRDGLGELGGAHAGRVVDGEDDVGVERGDAGRAHLGSGEGSDGGQGKQSEHGAEGACVSGGV